MRLFLWVGGDAMCFGCVVVFHRRLSILLGRMMVLAHFVCVVCFVWGFVIGKLVLMGHECNVIGGVEMWESVARFFS